MGKQSRADQIKRIENFACPVHGVSLGQVSFHAEGMDFTVGGCTRRDCDIRAIVDSVRDGAEQVLKIRQIVTLEQLERIQVYWVELFDAFSKEARKAINAELESMAREPEVQLPVCPEVGCEQVTLSDL